MSDGTTRDVIVVGGGAAGLSAALTLARARRRVTVVDAGTPRNAPAAGVHGLLGLEGTSPHELLRRGRDEVRSFGGEILTGQVVDVSRAAEGFVVSVADHRILHSRRLLVATGVVDELPDIPGVAERWGRDVVHCPYCHGWEVRDRRIGVLATGPMSVHQALLFRQWSDDVLLFSHGRPVEPDDAARLRALEIPVVDGVVAGLAVVEDRLVGVRMDDGRVVEAQAVAVTSRLLPRAELFAGIGVHPEEHPVGSFVASDATGRTSVPGVWVAGNATDLFAQVSAAAADGARAAQHLNADLVMEDVQRRVERLVGSEER